MTETPKPCNRNRNCLVASTNEVEKSNKVTFFTLPAEIRLQIYDLLLINRSDTDQERIILPTADIDESDDGIEYLQDRTIEPAILQTCKQIYREANPILYSQNVFWTENPEDLFRFFAQIGLVNFKLIKKLEVRVPSNAQLSSWVGLLYLLAEEASPLRCIRVYWDANLWNGFGSPRYSERQAWGSVGGLGDNLLFVRALGKIQGLEELVIEGFYAKNWPAYLEERMSARVQVRCGRYSKVTNDENLSDLMRILLETNSQMFTEYQQGTENLIP
ncbi:hypothetical protein V8E54_000288 [Elaphomyces granulatus]